MTTRVGINGFGRMGRLALRAAWGFDPVRPASLSHPSGGWGHGELEIVHINELNGGAATAAHLLTFDSVHGQWPVPVAAEDDAIRIAEERVTVSAHDRPGDVPWDAHGVTSFSNAPASFVRPRRSHPISPAASGK